MLKWALIFAVVALIAGLLGFGGIAGAAAGVAKFLFFAFLVIFAVFLVLGLFAGHIRPPPCGRLPRPPRVHLGGRCSFQ
jgi:uncharacterized membrane protein YtjA (UPF0391 family)